MLMIILLFFISFSSCLYGEDQLGVDESAAKNINIDHDDAESSTLLKDESEDEDFLSSQNSEEDLVEEDAASFDMNDDSIDDGVDKKDSESSGLQDTKEDDSVVDDSLDSEENDEADDKAITSDKKLLDSEEEPAEEGSLDSKKESQNTLVEAEESAATLKEDDSADMQDHENNEESLVSEDLASENLEEEKSDLPEEYGIHTISVEEPSGNWLYKRFWWEKTEALYDKIKKVFARVLDSRMYFFEQRVNLDRMVLDPFYQSIGLVHSELQENISLLLNKTKEHENNNSDKALSESSVIKTLQEEQETLASLQNEVAAVRDVNRAINDALHKLMNQINLCRKWEQEVWHRFRSIAHELSDKVARDHYYAVAALWKNIKKAQAYIEGDFSKHFEMLVSDAKARTKLVQDTIEILKEKGIDLKDASEMLLHDDHKKSDENQESENADEEDEEEVEESGWWATIKYILLAPFNAVAAVWHAIFG